ncbi:MAG TPA: DUF1573 domain-containing protein, partial [Bacteroidota bacterium]|nr:DUF1573 domain-containing protein [Bacteroidota bacterium]
LIDNSDHLDFGDLFLGQPITRQVQVKNIGKDTLHVRDVRAQCGCTTTGLANKIIPPHGESDMTITFNSTGYHPGPVVKHVTIYSDDTTGRGMYVIEFHTNLITALMLNPVYFSFNMAKLDTTYKKTITVLNTYKSPVTITSIEVPDKEHDKDFTFTLGKKTIPPQDSTVLIAEFHPQKPGQVQGKITLNTDNPLQAKIDVTYLSWVNRK